ncbi:unnamed protein product [Cuscuta campestris]|uniref:AP180 N-terminal homology (ANTH) domain-containing protein n=1 Tax=Cuscuta campestris TaxID=132261 RepID=A0A484KB95_9ASTE|nr:unnamed protein product [Cuscuta campestris]
MELSIPESVRVHEIFCRVAKQFDELELFYNWSRSSGIARSSEYPDVENYPQKKLDLMDDLIREKSEIEWRRRNEHAPRSDEREPDPDLDPDMNAIKALPPPPTTQGDLLAETKEEETSEKEKVAVVGDLLSLAGDEAAAPQDDADRLALALFDGGCESGSAAAAGAVSPWKAFNDSGDWETALVQSASYLSSQKAQLPGGFDTLLLDGLYKQGTMNHAMATSNTMSTGSASSIAYGPTMLGLPAPVECRPIGPHGYVDPFAASLSIPPPGYVQMSEMEKKQRLLMEEKLMWQQYARDGMQGRQGTYRCQKWRRNRDS